MKWILTAMTVALAVLATPASAQTNKPDVSSAPSAQNSGAGMAGPVGGADVTAFWRAVRARCWS